MISIVLAGTEKFKFKFIHDLLKWTLQIIIHISCFPSLSVVCFLFFFNFCFDYTGDYYSYLNDVEMYETESLSEAA